MSELSHVARLPLGYVVSFAFEPPAGITASFEPEPGPILNRRARRRFLEAYRRERSAFLEMVATIINGNIAVVDVERGGITDVSISKPATKQ